MLYKISERDENAYSEQVHEQLQKYLCFLFRYFYDLETIFHFLVFLVIFDENVGSRVSTDSLKTTFYKPISKKVLFSSDLDVSLYIFSLK